MAQCDVRPGGAQGHTAHLAHVVRVLVVGVVLGLYVIHLVTQRLLVQMERRAVAAAHVQRHVLRIENLCHHRNAKPA
jgi:hypothetical protein